MDATLLSVLVALPLGAAPAIYLAGRLTGLLGRHPGGMWMAAHTSAARWLALAALAAAWVQLGRLASNFSVTAPATFGLGAAALRLDGLGLLIATLALLLGRLVVYFSRPASAGEKYYAMIVALVGALIALACADDLFNLWVWFELIAVLSYLLVGFEHRRGALEASVKYLVQGAVGSALVLVGIGLVLAQAGTLRLDEIRQHAGGSPLLLAAGGLFLVGFGVKAGLVPLHTWLPGAYSQAPSGVSAMLSAIVTKAALVALLRALGAVADLTVSWGALLMAVGALNILAGNLLALRQRHIKRQLAYSSLGQLGYILIGLGIGIDTGQAGAIQGSVFHMIAHGLLSGLAFLAAGALLYGLRGAAGEPDALTIDDLAGAAQRYPLPALALSLAALGLAGLPPLVGFMSKWQIFVAGVATRNIAILGLIGFAALNSVLSLAYYAPLVNVVYRVEPSTAVRGGRNLPATMHAPLAALALAVLALGVWPALSLQLTAPVAAAILGAFGR
jgi:proton-translocating NADH-quinone oxidoreductase chain N